MLALFPLCAPHPHSPSGERRTGPADPRSRIRALLGACAVLPLLALPGCAGAPESAPTPTPAQEPETGSAASGEVRVDGAWIPEPATPDSTTAYFTVTNAAEADDALVAVESPVSGEVELGSTTETPSGASQMGVVEEIPVPGGGSTELRSGGFHLMVNDLSEPLAAGDAVTLTLTFESGSVLDVEAPVLERSAGPSSEDGGAEDHSGH
ncbi:copper chaperone PCu(A)C [Marinactinospora rubrisoli]|uniref:Copper chaperone PCu(A)C n=1 Tax=Marinactinospora rubrisoli TaxID=2715399 RepID=A0ABW2KDE0_9ACTN